YPEVYQRRDRHVAGDAARRIEKQDLPTARPALERKRRIPRHFVSCVTAPHVRMTLFSPRTMAMTAMPMVVIASAVAVTPMPVTVGMHAKDAVLPLTRHAHPPSIARDATRPSQHRNRCRC